MEVLHGDITITLSDQDAIRGINRVRSTVKREMKAIGRERAVVHIEGDLKKLRRDLKEADGLIEKHQNKIQDLTAKRDDLSGAQKGAVTRQLNAEKARLAVLESEIGVMREQEKRVAARLESYKRLNREAKFEAQQTRVQQKAETDLGRIIDDNNRKREKQRQLSVQETRDVAKLRQEYDKARTAYLRLAERRGTAGGRAREIVSPEIRQRVEIDQARALGEMEILHDKLVAMGHDPVDIDVRVDRHSNVLAKLADIGNIGTRIGPFAGTLAAFTKAALVLGPIIIGLVGYVGGLAGAIGTGLTGALGIGAGGLAAFGLSLGGVGLLTASLLRDFKGLNTLQKAYHTQVLKTGANSDKAKKKLKEFNHALGEVTPTTRAAFLSLDKLQDRWRGLRKQAKPDFMNALGEGIRTLNADFDVFSHRTLQAFRLVSRGFQDWMRGLRSTEAQGIIDNLMGNANEAIPPLMRGLGHLAAAFGRMAESFSRFLAPMLRDFDHWAAGIDKASQNTDKLDRGTGHLYRSFRQVWDVVVALGKVIGEFALTAMGPGGRMLDDLAGGLNHIAETIRGDRLGDNKLGEFLDQSADTTSRLFRALAPLLGLFVEFSTIMRPWTDALLDIAGAVGSVTKEFAGWPGIHTLLQGMAALWLFNRATGTTLSLVAGGLQATAAALRAVGLAGAAAKVAGAAGAAGAATGGVRRGAVAGATTGAAAQGVKAGRGAATAEAGAAGAIAGRTFAQKMGLWVAAGIATWQLSNWIENKIHSSIATVRNAITSGGQADLGEALGNLLNLNQHKDTITNHLTHSISDIIQDVELEMTARRLGVKIDVDFKTEKARQAAKLLLDQIDRTGRGIAGSMREAASDLELNMRAISQSMGTHSARGKVLVAASFRAAASEIRNGIHSGAIDTEKGMAQIHEYLVKALTTLGLSTAGANLYLRHRDPLTGSKQGGQYTPKAEGGFIGRPGGKGRDLIPLMVGEGEAVINRHQQSVIDYGLQAIGLKGGLAQLFDTVRQPHYAATGYYNKRKRTTAGPRETELGQAAAGRIPTIPRYLTRQGGLLGRVTQGTVDSYRTVAQARLKQVADAGGILGVGKGAAIRSGGALARSLGLVVTSTTGGTHAPNSWHYKGRAVDVSGAPGNMMQFFKQAAARWGKNILELFYDPAGWYIKNGAKVTGAIGGHSDHVHLAMARGGFAKAARGKKPKGKAGGTFSATSYGPPWGGIQGTGVTRTGVNLKNAPHKYGIAVDPSVIPLGSNVHVWPNPFGYKGTFKAFDTGGAIKGRRIDFYDWRGRRNQLQWGQRSVQVSYGRLSTSVPQPQAIRGTAPPPKKFGATSDYGNIIAQQEAAVNMTTRSNEYGAAALNQMNLRSTLGRQNVISQARIGDIDKLLGGRLTKDRRSSLLSERAGLVGSIDQNQQRKFDLFKQARDNAFEFLRGKGNRRVDIDYRKSLADRTETLDDDLKVAQDDEEYWTARVKYLKKHGNRADVTEARNSLNAATSEVKTIQENIKSNQLQAQQNFLGAIASKAGLTSGLEDDLVAAQYAQQFYQEQFNLADQMGDFEGISRWGDQLRGANEQIKTITQQINLLPVQTNQMLASLTNDLNDDVSAAQGLVNFWGSVFATAVGADRVDAGNNLAGAMSELKSAQRNAELLPLERDQAMAALTETLDDDKAAMVRLRDYWAGQLDAAKASADIPGQIEAAQNLKGLNDQINEAQNNVAAQMILLSEARRDLYKAFSSNAISMLPAGFATGGTTTYDQARTVNVVNNFQQPPADPHTWSAGVNWELQAAV